MSSELLLGLEYDNQLPPVVRDEFEQVIAAVQTAFNSFGGAWIAPTFAASDFFGSGAMAWTVTQGSVVTSNGVGTVSYVVIGKTMHWALYLTGTTVGGTLSTLLEVRVPGGFRINGLHAGTYFYSDAGTAGIGYWTADQSQSDRVKFAKMDSSNWSASSGVTHIRASMTFEVQ